MYFTAFSMLVHHNCTTDNNRTIRSFDLQGVCQFMTQIKYLLLKKYFGHSLQFLGFCAIFQTKKARNGNY